MHFRPFRSVLIRTLALGLLLGVGQTTAFADGGMSDGANMFSAKTHAIVDSRLEQIAKVSGKTVDVITVKNVPGHDIGHLNDLAQKAVSHDHSDVLIYIDHDDRMLVIDVSKTVSTQISPTEKQSIQDDLTGAFHKGQFDDGMQQAIAHVARDVGAGSPGEDLLATLGKFFPWIPVIPILLLIAAGYFFLRRRRAPAAAPAMGDEPSLAALLGAAGMAGGPSPDRGAAFGQAMGSPRPGGPLGIVGMLLWQLRSLPGAILAFVRVRVLKRPGTSGGGEHFPPGRTPPLDFPHGSPFGSVPRGEEGGTEPGGAQGEDDLGISLEKLLGENFGADEWDSRETKE